MSSQGFNNCLTAPLMDKFSVLPTLLGAKSSFIGLLLWVVWNNLKLLRNT